MREYDLSASDIANKDFEIDVCIIGAGAAGIYLAKKLVQMKHSVVLLEAGDRKVRQGESLGIEPIFSDKIYPGATEGRMFGIGGTTSRWGGLLVPYSKCDIFSSEAGEFNPWQQIVDTVDSFANKVMYNLGISHEADFDRYPGGIFNSYKHELKNNGIDTISSIHLPFGLRNLSRILEEKKVRNSNIDVIINAVAKRWEISSKSNGKSQVNKLEAVSANGKTVQIKAKHFVVAAGAIESTRILLEAREQNSTGFIHPSAELGCNLSDHLSCKIADVVVDDYISSAKIFGPRFDKSCMRTFRFVERNPDPNNPRYFTHFIYDFCNHGIDVAKEILSSIQLKKLPDTTISKIARGSMGLLSLAFSRYVRSRLFIPDGTPVHLQLDIEQVPSISNSVKLTNELDCYGRPTANVNWRINDADYANIETVASRFIRKWPGVGNKLPELIPVLKNTSVNKPYDTYHPVGTCRMGQDNGAVVDSNLCVHGSDNLWVLSTAVLPSAGTANPTFSMLCLGEKLGECISQALTRHRKI